MAEAEAWVMIPKLDKDKTGCVLDMRPLVLCKDCKHRSDKTYTHGITGKEVYVCQVNDIAKQPNWFCADGERKSVKE